VARPSNSRGSTGRMAVTAKVRLIRRSLGNWAASVGGLTEQRMDVVAHNLGCEILRDSELRQPGDMLEGESVLEAFEGLLAGKELARYAANPARFQPLPIRTDREVFPQAAHPVGFIARVMGPAVMAATFTRTPPHPIGGAVSSPSTSPGRRRGTRYSISATRHPASGVACAASAGFALSFQDSRGPH